MGNLYEDAADNFLQLASPQRLEILFNLLENKTNPTMLARQLGATKQEVHRNFMRLAEHGLIEKTRDGSFCLTSFGQTMCTQVPSLVFFSQNRRYFESHTLSTLPSKFIMRTGQLASGKYVKGVAKTLEAWKSIYRNAHEYVYEILSEVPLDLIEPLLRRVRQGVHLQYILSESTIVPKGRKALLKKSGIEQLIRSGLIKRRMIKTVNTALILNEKECCVMFPTLDGESDITGMFYGKDAMFHEWCLDYFRYCWYAADVFRESKLRE